MSTGETQLDHAVGRIPAIVWVSGIFLPVAILGIFFLAPMRTWHPNIPAQLPADHEMQDMEGMHHGAVALQETPERKAKRLADKRESEFNHHLAGVLLIMAALFFIAQGNLEKRWSAVKFAWPMCFLATGLFIFAFQRH